jgi:hypothetical protein
MWSWSERQFRGAAKPTSKWDPYGIIISAPVRHFNVFVGGPGRISIFARAALANPVGIAPTEALFSCKKLRCALAANGSDFACARLRSLLPERIDSVCNSTG